jgi:protein phosphatase
MNPTGLIDGLICLECDNLNPVAAEYCSRCGVSLHGSVLTAPADRSIVYAMGSDEIARLKEHVGRLTPDRTLFVGAIEWPAEPNTPIRLTLPAGAMRLAEIQPPRVDDAWQTLHCLASVIDAVHAAGLRLNGLSFATIVIGPDGRALGVCLPPCLTPLAAPPTEVPLLGINGSFAAPEIQQYTMQTAGPQSDVFSLAVVFACLARGCSPVELSALQFEPAGILESFGTPTRTVLTNALALDPSRRPRSAKELITELVKAQYCEASQPDFHMTAAGISDIGLGGRELNEDAFAAIVSSASDRFGSRQHAVAVVADGMGGTQAGERASQFAVDETVRTFLTPPDWLATASETIAVERASSWLLERNEHAFVLGTRLGVGKEFGTTLSAVVLLGSRLLLMHLGDSRIYRLRRNSLELLTKDQSLAQRYLDDGRLTLEQARTSEHRSVLISHLGSERCSPQVACLAIERGDVLLLATDGLLEGLQECDLIEMLGRFPPEEACSLLVEHAKMMLRKSSSSENDAETRSPVSDNMTAVIVRVAPVLRIKKTDVALSLPAVDSTPVVQSTAAAESTNSKSRGVADDTAENTTGDPDSPATGSVRHD